MTDFMREIFGDRGPKLDPELSVKAYARLFPLQTCVLSFSEEEYGAEVERLELALEAGGHDAAGRMGLVLSWAVDVLLERIHDVARNQSIRRYAYKWDWVHTSDGVEVTFVFASIAQAVQFKLATSLL